MSEPPAVFLGHSHVDKLVACRLVRRFTAHGIKVWIDERELRIGARLGSSLRDHIERFDVLLVVASGASESRMRSARSIFGSLLASTATVLIASRFLNFVKFGLPAEF